MQLTAEQQKRAEKLSQMSQPQWDAVCKQCGMCCLCKIEEQSKKISDKIEVLYLKRCCKHFDTKTCKCTIYKNRFNNPDCRKVDINVVLNTDILPASCGYVEYIFGPAKHKPVVNFNKITPVEDDYEQKLTLKQFMKDVIYNSILWTRRNTHI